MTMMETKTQGALAVDMDERFLPTFDEFFVFQRMMMVETKTQGALAVDMGER